MTQLTSMTGFTEVKPTELEGNFTKMIKEDWGLVTAGAPESFNTITIGWATMGYLWQLPVVTVYIHPIRYTHSFTEREERMTLTFFDSAKYKKDLTYLGTHSGRDEDKIAQTALTPVFTPSGLPAFEEATIIIEGVKIYKNRIKRDNFYDKEFMQKKFKQNPEESHDVYTLEIEKIWVKDSNCHKQ